LEVTAKRGLHNLCGRKFISKSRTKNFSGKFGEIREESFAPKNLSAPTPMMKRHLRPRCPSLKGQRGKCPRRSRRLCAYYFTRTLFTRCCKLPCVTAMNMN